MKKAALISSGQDRQLYLIPPLLALLFLVSFIVNTAQAQAPVPPITSSGLNTVVTTNGNIHDITGGTRPGGANGTNLFHSFGDFSVPTNNIANFLNAGSIDLAGNALAAGLPTSNILGRVTAGNPSIIFGMIQTNGTGGFSNANLFLMNPAGFLFGPNATVNVGGMVTFTSADYLKLTDNARFNAIPNASADALLTALPVAAFGFLGSNPGAITVQGSQFSVSEGISLVGGDITTQTGTLADETVQPAKLSAPGGQINVASVAGPGELSASTFEPQPGMALGTTTLGQGSLVDVSGNASGTVRIRGGSFVMDQAVISADTVDANGGPVAIDINVTENVSITNVDVSALTARTTGTGNAGKIRVASGSMDVTSIFSEAPFFFSTIDTHTSGPGNAGNVTINTGNLTLAGDPFTGASWFIDSGTSGLAPGRGGDVSITGKTIDFQTTAINTGNLFAFFLDEGGAGTAGNVTIAADQLKMSFSQIVTDSNDFVTPVGTSGDITIAAREVDLFASSLSTTGYDHSGSIRIAADQLIATESGIQGITTFGPGGEIRITGNVIEFREGSNIASSTMADGHAGPIIITATDHVAFLESSPGGRPGGIFNNSFGERGSLGNAGDVIITTPSLQLTGGTRINTATASSGRGGNVTITADTISMSGENGGFEIESLFNLGTVQSSGIYTRTIGGNCIGLCGNAGNISITTSSLSMGSGSQINSGTSSSGQGGTIAITAGNTIAMSGTLSTGQPGGIQSRTIGADPDAGDGGEIALAAGQSVTISDGASVSSSSTGPGNTGNIQIDAGNQLAMTDSSVTTEANQASGGAIKITTTPSGTVELSNSTISASVLDGTGGGGSVNIDPQFVILQNSQILAQAKQGPGGNISITTNLLLPDANSVISASSEFGVNGTVTIQSPNAPGSGQVQPLGKTPLLPTSLLTQRCAALAGGEFSSFTVAGRDSLPTEPGSWLASPLATLNAGMGLGVKAEGVSPVAQGEGQEGETAFLSLRQIAPAGFLTQAFALDWSAGCQS